VTHIISPKSWLKSFSRLGDPGTTLGRCSCEFAGFYSVRSRTIRACLADSLLGVADHSADRLDKNGVFQLEVTFVLRTVHALSSRQSAAARRTVRSVRRFLPRLFGSFVSFLVLLAKVVRFLCFVFSASACASRNRF
jgi:hypothetical protein